MSCILVEEELEGLRVILYNEQDQKRCEIDPSALKHMHMKSRPTVAIQDDWLTAQLYPEESYTSSRESSSPPSLHHSPSPSAQLLTGLVSDVKHQLAAGLQGINKMLVSKGSSKTLQPLVGLSKAQSTDLSDLLGLVRKQNTSKLAATSSSSDKSSESAANQRTERAELSAEKQRKEAIEERSKLHDERNKVLDHEQANHKIREEYLYKVAAVF